MQDPSSRTPHIRSHRSAPTVMTPSPAPISTLEDWLSEPPELTEWVDGQIVAKQAMTLPHSEIQLTLGSLWRAYAISSGQGGRTYTEPPCRTRKQGRRPDVAYLSADLAEQFGRAPSLPQVFPLIAEIASPTDYGEELLNRAQEYLQSPGGQEVWLVFPAPQLVIILTPEQRLILGPGEILRTQRVLLGFQAPVNEVLGQGG